MRPLVCSLIASLVALAATVTPAAATTSPAPCVGKTASDLEALGEPRGPGPAPAGASADAGNIEHRLAALQLRETESGIGRTALILPKSALPSYLDAVRGGTIEIILTRGHLSIRAGDTVFHMMKDGINIDPYLELMAKTDPERARVGFLAEANAEEIRGIEGYFVELAKQRPSYSTFIDNCAQTVCRSLRAAGKGTPEQFYRRMIPGFVGQFFASPGRSRAIIFYSMPSDMTLPRLIRDSVNDAAFVAGTAGMILATSGAAAGAVALEAHQMFGHQERVETALLQSEQKLADLKLIASFLVEHTTPADRMAFLTAYRKDHDDELQPLLAAYKAAKLEDLSHHPEVFEIILAAELARKKAADGENLRSLLAPRLKSVPAFSKYYPDHPPYLNSTAERPKMPLPRRY